MIDWIADRDWNQSEYCAGHNSRRRRQVKAHIGLPRKTNPRILHSEGRRGAKIRVGLVTVLDIRISHGGEGDRLHWTYEEPGVTSFSAHTVDVDCELDRRTQLDHANRGIGRNERRGCGADFQIDTAIVRLSRVCEAYFQGSPVISHDHRRLPVHGEAAKAVGA